MNHGGITAARLGARLHRIARTAGAVAVGLSGLLHVAAAPAPAGPESFIVVLRDGVDSRAVARDHSARHQARVQFVYEHALHGYAATVSPGAIGAIAADGRVAYVERDQTVSINTTQSGATWGLDRIDQRALPVSSTYNYTSTAAGVTAYIIDTGIRFSHSEFGGRAVSGFDAVDGGAADDCNGHGTHVAGTVGGNTYGVAKGVSLVAVRVLNCTGSGSWAGVIAGIDWVTGNHASNAPAVANMSLGGGASTAIDTAVKNSIADGVSYAIAAGNGNQGGVAQDACKSSPARVPEAMTIGATGSTDTKASWSNYGNCVDWFAPGVGITSGWYSSDTATNTISGTSMATPHTTGVAARYLQTNPGASPAAVRAALYESITKGVVTNSKTTNNHLLYIAPPTLVTGTAATTQSH
jgi:subtilisin family serine protease